MRNSISIIILILTFTFATNAQDAPEGKQIIDQSTADTCADCLRQKPVIEAELANLKEQYQKLRIEYEKALGREKAENEGKIAVQSENTRVWARLDVCHAANRSKQNGFINVKIGGK
jgi:hypothetical protein